MPATLMDPLITEAVAEQLGPTAVRFTHTDDALTVLNPDVRDSVAIVTGFGPTNAPTAGTLSVCSARSNSNAGCECR